MADTRTTIQAGRRALLPAPAARPWATRCGRCLAARHRPHRVAHGRAAGAGRRARRPAWIVVLVSAIAGGWPARRAPQYAGTNPPGLRTLVERSVGNERSARRQEP